MQTYNNISNLLYRGLLLSLVILFSIQPDLSVFALDDIRKGVLSPQTTNLDELTSSVQPALSLNNEFILQGESWSYFKGVSAPPFDWNTLNFDDQEWLTGPTGIGYGDGDDATILSDMQGIYSVVYMRRKFNVSDHNVIAQLVLQVDYDDGFVAYLNGIEVARRGLGNPDTPVSNTALSSDHEAGLPEQIDISNKISYLNNGLNILAIQVHNSSLDSSDLSMIPELFWGGDENGINDPPTVSLSNTTNALNENIIINFALKVADITVTDDILGTNVLSLSGTDSALFEITGNELFIRAGTLLDYETNPTLDVNIDVDDVSIGVSPDDSVSLSINVIDVIDEDPPVVLSITRVGVSPTSATLVDFAVTFSESVSGVDKDDFVLNTKGTTAASIKSVNGSGSTYIVTVDAGLGNGFIGLDLVDNDSIKDSSANPLGGIGGENGNFSDGEKYQISGLRFAAFGDYGVGVGGASEQAVANLVHAWDPNIVITTGDNNYYNMSSTLAWDETVGYFYGDFIRYPGGSSSEYAPGSAINRFFPSLGNHDIDGEGYEEYFDLPGMDVPGSNTSGNEGYYDFAVGPAHFFVINSDSREPDGITSNSKQALWLKKQLETSTAPWKFVYMHHPPYDSGSNYLSYPTLRWPFEEWGATAVFAGHEHNYERILRDDNADGVIFPYFVSGAGGGILNGFSSTPVVGSQVRFKDTFGSMLVNASYNEITFEFWSIENGGTLIDTYTITNGPPSVWLTDTTLNLSEGIETSNPVQVAEIVISDDGYGINNLLLSGTDAVLFEITGAGLFLKAGTVLDASTNPALDVVVEIDDPNLGAGTEDSATLSISVTPKIVPIITWSDPADITYGTVLSATQLNAEANVPGTFVYTPASGTVLDAGTHTLQVDFIPDDSANYSNAAKQVNINVIQAAPVIIWGNPADITYGTALSATQLNASADVPGTFLYTPANGTVLNAGTHTLQVDFTPDDSTNYSNGSKQVSITVTKAAPVITWSNPSDITYGTALSAIQLNASADVLGTFLYTPASGIILDAGTHILQVDFTPDNSTNYSNGSKQVNINVMQAAPTITWNDPADITYGTALSATQLSASADVPGTFVYTPASGTVLDAGAHTLQVDFTPDDSANYSNAAKQVNINVTQASPVITWGNPADITYSTALSATQLNASADVPGTFLYTPASGTVLNAGTHTLLADFTPDDSTNYSNMSKQVSITVTKAAPTITWSNPADITYGTAMSATQLNASADVPGTFVYTPSSGTVLNAGTHTLQVDFTPDDKTNYSNASKQVSIDVTKATPIITWSNPADIIYGLALSATQLNANANISGTFLYTPASGTVLDAGTHTVQVNFTPDDSINYSNVSKQVSINVTKAAPIITWNNPADITYGTALSAIQLNASADVPGTFVYTPASGTILNTGTDTLQVNFTPDDSINYTSAIKQVSITVMQAAPTITWDNPADITYGTALGVIQLNASADVPGTFVYTPASGTVLNVGTRTLQVDFTPDDSKNYSHASKQVSITVTQAAPTIIWDNPADISYGTTLGATHLNASADVPGTFVYTPASGTLLNAGIHTLQVNFTPDDSNNYSHASKQVSINVTQAASVITWSDPADTVYGTALSTMQLNASANIPGTFVYTPVSGTILNVGTHTLQVDFTPDDITNYTNASKQVSIIIVQAAPTIWWNDPIDIAYGMALSTIQLNASADVAGTFLYTPAIGAVLDVGTHTLQVDFTPDDNANYRNVSKQVNINITQAAPTITWSNPAGITYGTALNVTQLNASADVPGTFVYTPASGALLDAGTHTLQVDFIPDDNTNYSNATKHVSITVTQTAPSVTWSDPADITYGTVLSATQLNASADIPGTFVYTPAIGTVLDAGTYTLQVDFTPDDSNYSVASRDVVLNVMQAMLTVKVKGHRKALGSPDPHFAFSYDGFVNGDDSSVISSPPTCQVVEPHETVGDYKIICADGLDENYDFFYIAGTLTVFTDTESPLVTTIALASPNPTSALGVDFEVTFSETVINVGESDFALFATGDISGYRIVSVTPTENLANTYTVTITTGNYNGTLQLGVHENNDIQDTAGNPLASGLTTSDLYTVNKTLTFLSQRSYDGWVLESGEVTNKGGRKNNRGKVFYVGDDSDNRQYRGILSFDTSGIPDGAVITHVTLKVKKAGLVGTNPFRSHRGLFVDISNSRFGTSPKLQTSDFQTRASKNLVGKFTRRLVSNWYISNLSSVAYPYVNVTGTTQFRMRFKKDDNNDGGADYFKFYSGNAPIASRPQLIVEYYLP